MRYRDLDRIDLDAAREKVRQWMLAHPGGTPARMAADLKGGYPQFPEHMAVVLRASWPPSRTAPGNWTPAEPPGRPGDDVCYGAKQP